MQLELLKVTRFRSRSYSAIRIGTSRSFATATCRIRRSSDSAHWSLIFSRRRRNPASSAGSATRRRTALGFHGLWTYRSRRSPSSYLFNRWNLWCSCPSHGSALTTFSASANRHLHLGSYCPRSSTRGSRNSTSCIGGYYSRTTPTARS